MGQVSTEQTTAIIDSITELVDAAQPDEVVNVVQPIASEPNYWWLLSLAILPVLLGWWLNKRKKK
jgi:hypothetical protein